MLIRILLVAAAVIVVLGVVIATRPSAFRIERSVTIAAPASLVFSHLEDFHRWSAWSPYDKLDPGVQKTFSGPATGPGASFHYLGKKTGEGRMTVTSAHPNELLAIRAEFIKPFAATNEIAFTLKPAPSGVTVGWAMSGTNNFLFKAFGLVVNVDRIVGKEFETGLADLKRLSESEAARTVATRY
jgi:uncharacterized protein YndB with AHSA1/START domain